MSRRPQVVEDPPIDPPTVPMEISTATPTPIDHQYPEFNLHGIYSFLLGIDAVDVLIAQPGNPNNTPQNEQSKKKKKQ